MRHELQFLSPLTGRDENGAETQTWIASQKVWCNIEFLESGSDEKSEGARIHSFVNTRIKLRYLEGITAKMRLYARGYEFDILTVLPDLRNSYLVLECKQDRPSTLLAWSTQDGQYWTDPDGNQWIFEDPSQTLTNATGISWTDGQGRIWTPNTILDDN